MNLTERQIDYQRKAVIKRLLPDTCNIQPMGGTNVVVTDGILTQTDAPLRTYEDSTAIPCRFDISRAFRPDKLKAQTVVVDEYNLELPFDVIIDPSDTIISKGRTYVIRKIKQASNYDVTTEATVVETDAQFDT